MALAETRTPLHFLLFPPLGALAYGVVANPDHPNADFVGIVVAPTLTALAVLGVGIALGATPLAYGVAVLATIVILRVFHTALVPPVALAVLMIFLRVRSPAFVTSVFVATVVLYLVFRLWKAALIDRWHPPL